MALGDFTLDKSMKAPDLQKDSHHVVDAVDISFKDSVSVSWAGEKVTDNSIFLAPLEGCST